MNIITSTKYKLNLKSAPKSSKENEGQVVSPTYFPTPWGAEVDLGTRWIFVERSVHPGKQAGCFQPKVVSQVMVMLPKGSWLKKQPKTTNTACVSRATKKSLKSITAVFDPS